MPTYGGLSPGFERYGGGGDGLTLERVTKSLLAQKGTAFDTATTSPVYVECHAYARAITDAWHTNERLANQWDPLRVTDFLERWEDIFALTPSPSDSLIARRARLATAVARIGKRCTYQAVYDALAAAMGSAFVNITHTDSASANVWTPTGWPMGSHDSSGQVTWYSTVAFLAIRLQQVSGVTDEEFYELVGNIHPILDHMLPAWVTWGWYRYIHLGGTVHGFFLDEEFNLDNAGFDV